MFNSFLSRPFLKYFVVFKWYLCISSWYLIFSRYTLVRSTHVSKCTQHTLEVRLNFTFHFFDSDGFLAWYAYYFFMLIYVISWALYSTCCFHVARTGAKRLFRRAAACLPVSPLMPLTSLVNIPCTKAYVMTTRCLLFTVFIRIRMGFATDVRLPRWRSRATWLDNFYQGHTSEIRFVLLRHSLMTTI